MTKRPSKPADALLGQDPGSLAEFESLLAYLKQSRGFDFTAYKRSSLMRRVMVRMQARGVKGFGAYLDFLQVDPEEFIRLFNTILINVTSFFRDAASWEVLREEVVPRLAGHPGARDTIRVWSAGCASGEEAYSIAMLLADRFGPQALRERVKIYATDVDEDALTQARHAVYGPRTADDVPGPLLEKYFERQDDDYINSKDLRRAVIFGRHDLIQDAPISRVNLLICRNCLMYFNTEAQARILARFHFALVPGGVLFLGKAESLLTQTAAFEPVDSKRRLFTKIDRPTETRHVTFAGPSERGHRPRDAACDVSPTAQLVVHRGGPNLRTSPPLRAHRASQALETALADLQSANEELGPTNQELQSTTNEERGLILTMEEMNGRP